MKKKRTTMSLTSAGILAVGILTTSFSTAASAEEYCSIAKLYATNIRESCNQFGANGMAALYQQSQFINDLKTEQRTNPSVEITPSRLTTTDRS